MKKLVMFLSVMIVLSAVGCAPAEPRTVEIFEPVDGGIAAAAELDHAGEQRRSPYYASPDYFKGNVSKTLHLLEKFKTYQQTSERSCGAACAVMVLSWFGETVSEDDLDKEMDIRYYDNPHEDGSYGASTQELAQVFRDRGYDVVSSADTQDADGVSFPDEASFAAFLVQQLDSGAPIITENVEWGGHWMVIIGYDTMGTELYNDDVLVFADPYDTTDHMQDGYLTASFERFYYTWFDHSVMKESERVQQYVTVSRPS